MNKLNIAVGLFGIHYNNNYKHWMGWDCNVDYRKSIENYKENLFINDNNYSFYTSTYNSDIIDELKTQYNFIKIKNIDFIHSGNNSFERNSRFIETLELIKECDREYDFIMITRFDLLFKSKPVLKEISNDKINILHGSKWGNDDSIIDDNWYFFRYDLISEIINILKENIDLHSHYYNKILDVNLLDNKHYYSHENPDYIILRK